MNSAYKKELHSEAWEKFAHKKSLKTAENKIVRLIILDREKITHVFNYLLCSKLKTTADEKYLK